MTIDGIWEISFSTDKNGMISQQCPVCKKKFKLDAIDYKNWDNKYFICPYCKIRTDTKEFLTKEQNEYISAIMLKEVGKSLLNSLNGISRISNSSVKMDVESKEAGLIPPPEETINGIETCNNCNNKYGLFEEIKSGICPYCSHSNKGIKVETELIEFISEGEEEMECKHADKELKDKNGEVVSYYYCYAPERGRSIIGFSEEEFNNWCDGCEVQKYENEEGCIHRNYSYLLGMGMKNVQETHLMIRCDKIKRKLFARDINKANEVCSDCDYYISNKAIKYRKVSDEPKTKKELIEDGSKLIYTFETTMRNYIESSLSKHYNNEWWKQGIPKDVRDNCSDRKQKDEKIGKKDCELLEYADFSDYKKIICRKDNWNNIFGQFLINKSSIETKLSEMEPIRNSIQHSRNISEREIEKLRIYTEEIIGKIPSS